MLFSAPIIAAQGRASFLQLQDFLLNGVAGNQSIGEDGPSLSNAMRAVYGLRFNRRVPPRIENEYILGGGEIQAQDLCLQD